MSNVLTVHAYDWVVRDKYAGSDSVNIHCWALDNESKPYLLRITNFPAFCYLELPKYVRYKVYEWDRSSVYRLMQLISYRLGEDAPLGYEFVHYKKTYYYRGERKYPMIRMKFNNLKAMQHCSNLFRNPLPTDEWNFIKCEVWEDNISVVRKLLTIKKIRYSQWFTVEGERVPDEEKVSTIKNEYIADWTTMSPVASEISKKWNSCPGILSMDIECYSQNHRAMPYKHNANDVAYMISAIYQRYHDASSRKRYGIIFGDCNDIPPEKLANCQIIRVNSEYEMIEAYGKILQETDPEIVIGYNILAFDYPYLNARVTRWNKSWPVLGRIDKEPAYLTSKEWRSGAYGYQSINILVMEGRISIDLLPIVRRDHKLDKYTLDHVCKHFLGKGKHDVSALEMFQIYESYQKTKSPESIADLTRVMAYCIQDSELVIDLFVKLNVWVGLVELSNIVGTTVVELFTRGQQVRCYSQLYDLAANKGYVLDRRDTPGFKFAGGFVFEPIPGLYDNVICLDFASLYPSIMMAKNICYTTLVPPELINDVPDEDCNIIEFDQEETDVVTEANDEDEDPDSEPEEILEELETKEVKKKIVTKHYKFKFYKKTEGLLPTLVRSLVSERRAVQAQMKGEKDPVIKVVMNARQLALKVSANSFFGFLGVHNGGKMPLIEGAMSITATGRMLINSVVTYLRDKYNAKVIYGDTDSCMVCLYDHIKDRKDCQYWGERLSQEISGVKKGDPLPGAKDPKIEVHTEDREGLFPPPLKMEFEKAMRMLAFKRKKYASFLIDKKGEFKRVPIRDSDGNVTGYKDELELLKRGIVLARRDNSQFMRKIYVKILDIIMHRRPITEAINVLVDGIQDLLDGKVPLDDLVIIRELGANYKSDSFFMKVFATNLKRDGKLVSPGDRLDFVIVENPAAKLLGDKMKLKEQFLENPGTYKIDNIYYIEKALMNPINQLFEIGFKDILPKLTHITCRPSNRHKPIGLDRPVLMLLKMFMAGHDIRNFKRAIALEIEKLTAPKPPPEIKIKLNVLPKPVAPKPTIKIILPTLPVSVNSIRLNSSAEKNIRVVNN